MLQVSGTASLGRSIRSENGAGLTCRRHVGAKAESRDIDDRIIRTEVVEDVTLSLVGEYDIARHCHQEARD